MKVASFAACITSILLTTSCATHSLKNQRATSVKDKDGNTYASRIMLDNREWTTENLKIDIPGSYCYEDLKQNCDRYGRLYTWESATKGCEMLGEGWQLPTNEEWERMAGYYGGVHRDSIHTGATTYAALLYGGKSGFNILLSGNREVSGTYKRLEAHGFYWTATETNAGNAWFYNFGKGSKILNRHNDGEKPGAHSVRCIKK
ncbi:MAG TPA: FISUMP domain-containing protein [Chryseolinea sp.]